MVSSAAPLTRCPVAVMKVTSVLISCDLLLDTAALVQHDYFDGDLQTVNLIKKIPYEVFIFYDYNRHARTRTEVGLFLAQVDLTALIGCFARYVTCKKNVIPDTATVESSYILLKEASPISSPNFFSSNTVSGYLKLQIIKIQECPLDLCRMGDFRPSRAVSVELE